MINEILHEFKYCNIHESSFFISFLNNYMFDEINYSTNFSSKEHEIKIQLKYYHNQ